MQSGAQTSSNSIALRCLRGVPRVTEGIILIATEEGGAADEEEDQGLNIFCVATGHLYERLLKIMMLSVMKTTKTPVKFWILKNFLFTPISELNPS